MKKIILIVFLVLPLLAQSQQQANLLGQWSDSTLVASTDHNNNYNEVWGIVHNNREYAIIGTTAGTHFIDVTDPTTPTEVAYVAGKAQGQIIIHRDYHDYGGYIYAVADEGNSSLQIIDYSNLPTSVSVVYDADSLIRRSHNIFIDTTSAKLYSLSNATNSTYQAMAIIDLSNPVNPTFVGSYNNFGGTVVSHVHDAFIRNDTAYLNCGGDGFFVMDFSNTASPQYLGGMTTYLQQGYNHSGWLNAVGDYYYMADENHNSPMKVVSVADLNDIKVLNTFTAGATHNFSIPHNQIVHDNKLFVAHYYDGLQVYDLSNPLTPNRTHFYDTYLDAARNRYEGAWGVYPFLPSGNILISDMQSGLFVLDLSPAAKTADIKETVELNVFPQPFNEVLNIQLENPTKTDQVQVSLMDITGKTIINLGEHTVYSGYNQLSLRLNDALPRGMYILNIKGQLIQSSKKVINVAK